MFLLVPAYPGCPGSKAVKRSLLLLLLYDMVFMYFIMYFLCIFVYFLFFTLCFYLCT